jgi:hypothetical protein
MGQYSQCETQSRVECCNIDCQNVEIVCAFFPTDKKLKTLSIYQCPICGALHGVISFWDTNKHKVIYERVKRAELLQTIRKFANLNLLAENNQKVKNGSKNNLFWLFSKNGNVYDFNGVRHYDRENKSTDCLVSCNSEFL